jgi:hypothetical protein
MKHPFAFLTALLLLAGFAHAQTKIDPDFVRFKNLADGCFNRQDYACAETNYRAALIIKSNDTYCKGQLNTIAQRKKAAVADQKQQADTKRREDAQRREQAAEKARLAKANQQAQAELEAERQRLAAERADLERQKKQTEQERQQRNKTETDKPTEAETVKQAETERQRLAKIEADKQAETERQRLAKIETDKQAETERQRLAKIETDKKAALEREQATRPAPTLAVNPASSTTQRPNPPAPTITATTRPPLPANTAPTAVPSTQLPQLRAEMARYRSQKNVFLGIAVAALAGGGITYVIANGKYSTYATEVASRNSTYVAQYAANYPGQTTPASDLLTPLSKGSYMGSSVAVAGAAIAGGAIFWLVSNGAARKYRATRNRLGSLADVTPLYNPAQQWAGVSVSMKF